MDVGTGNVDKGTELGCGINISALNSVCSNTVNRAFTTAGHLGSFPPLFRFHGGCVYFLILRWVGSKLLPLSLGVVAASPSTFSPPTIL